MISFLLLSLTVAQQIQTGYCKPTSDFKLDNQHALDPSTEFITALSSLETPRNVVFESPQCWMGSFQGMLNRDLRYLNNNLQTQTNSNLLANLPGGSVCASMTGDHRTLLALELTRCFFTESYLDFSPRCHLDMSSKDDIKVCIQSLSPMQFNSYNEFYNQIYNICTQLSQETWNTKLMESTYILSESSKIFSENLDQMFVDHRIEWEEFNQKYHSEQKVHFEKMNEKIEASSFEIDRISNIFQKINVALYHGKENITIFRSLLLFAANLNVLWIISSISRSRRARPYMIFIVTIGFCLEVGIFSIGAYSIVPTSLSDSIMSSIKKWTIIFESIIFLVFLCFVGKDKSHTNVTLEDIDIAQSEILRKLNQSLEAHRKEMLEREERLLKLFHEYSHMNNSNQNTSTVFQQALQSRFHPITPLYNHYQDHSLTPYEIMNGITPRRQYDERKTLCPTNFDHIDDSKCTSFDRHLHNVISTNSTDRRRASFTSFDSFESATSRINNMTQDGERNVENVSDIYSLYTENKTIEMEIDIKGKQKKRLSDELDNVSEASSSEKRQRRTGPVLRPRKKNNY